MAAPSLRAAGTVTGNVAVGAVNPDFPAGGQPLDLNVLTVAVKPYNATITTPTDWTKIGESTNGSTAAGTDTGSVKVAVYVRVGAFQGSLGNIGQSSANAMQAVIDIYQLPTGAPGWNYSKYTTGSDTTNGANFSAPGAIDLAVTTDYIVLGCAAINANLGTVSAIALAATGATLGATAVRANAVCTTGYHIRTLVAEATVSSGRSTAAPVLTYTDASSTSGSVVFLRLAASYHPNPRTWHNGDDCDQDTLNREWRDVFNWFEGYTKPAFGAYCMLSISLTSGAFAIPLDTGFIQRGGMVHATGDTKVYVPEDGWYKGVIDGSFERVVAGTYYVQVSLRVNGVTMVATNDEIVDLRGNFMSPFLVPLVAGDYVELVVNGTYTAGQMNDWVINPVAFETVPRLAIWYSGRAA